MGILWLQVLGNLSDVAPACAAVSSMARGSLARLRASRQLYGYAFPEPARYVLLHCGVSVSRFTVRLVVSSMAGGERLQPSGFHISYPFGDVNYVVGNALEVASYQ